MSADSRRDVVRVERILRRIGKRGIVDFGDRLDFEVVAQPEAERRAVRHAPLVLRERGDEVRLLIAIQRAGHANLSRSGYVRGSLGVERRVGPEQEGAVRVVLRRRPRADVFVLPAELQIVAAAAPGDEPRHRVVDLVGVVDARLRHGVLLIDERQVS